MRSITEPASTGTASAPAGLLDAVRHLADAELGASPEAVLLDRLRELNQLRCAVDAAVTATVGVVHARGAGGYDGAVSTRSWMRTQLRMSDPDAGAYVEAAVALPDLPEMAAEFTAGRVGLDHVGVLAGLRKKAGPEIARIGDQLLTGHALEVGAKELRRLAAQVREHFQTDNDPDPRPGPARYLKLHQTLDGVWGLDGTLTPEAGAILRTALDAAMTRPAPDDDRTPTERRHDTLIELINLALNSAELPQKGGEPAHLGVLVPLDDLRNHRDHCDQDNRDGHTTRRRRPKSHSPGLADQITAYLTSLDNDTASNEAARYDDETGRTDAAGTGRPWPTDWNGDVDLNDLLNGLDLDLLTGGLDLDGQGDHDGGHNPSPPGCEPPPWQLAGPPGLPDALSRQLVLPGLGDHRSRMPQPGQGGRTDYGDHLTPAAARRLACDCALLRVVLGPKDLPLSASQRTRLVPPTLRRILVARDGGCRFPGCDRPPAYTEAHHVTHWADGGPTVLENLVLFCGFHHHRVHDDGWTVEFDGLTLTVFRPDGTRLLVPGHTQPTEPQARRRQPAGKT